MSMLKSKGAIFPCLLAGTVIVLVGPILADPVTFSDGTFNDADWAATQIGLPLCGCVDEGSFVAGQVATGGNPGAYRETHLVWSGPGPIVGHLNHNAVYDPAVEGAITTLDYSFDNIELSNYGVGYAMLISQNGTGYIAFPVLGLGLDDTTSPLWTHVSHTGLTASEFWEDNSNGTHPDFSSSGAPIQFGYWTSDGGLWVHEDLSGIDNWSVTLNSGLEPPPVPEPEPSSSPEPSSVLLLGSIVVGMMAFFRRRLAERQ